MADPRPGFWTRRAIDGIRGACEALYPPNDLGAPTWEDTEMVARTLDWVDELPRPQARLVLLLFVAVELLTPLLAPALGRFSRLSPERRVALVRRWRGMRFYPLRFIGDSLKSVTTMIYLSHPRALEWVGMFKHCDHPADPFHVPMRERP